MVGRPLLANSEGGYMALLAVLVVGAATTAIALALLATGTDSQRAALVLQQSRQARALAVACGQEASQIIHDNIAYSGTANLSLGQGSCTYTVSLTTATTRTIAVTGTVGQVVRKLLATATVGASTLTIGSWKDTATHGPATPAFVQLKSVTPQSSPTSVAATFNAAQTAGNLNVIIIGWANSTTTISSVADTAGNTYQLAAPLTRGNSQAEAIYYARNITGGTPTVTVTFNAATAFPDLRIMEYSGIDAVSPYDSSASAVTTNSNPSSSGTVNTSYPTTILVSGGTTSGGYTAAGPGYTLRTITPNGGLVEDRVVTTTGAYTATAPSSGSWVQQVAAFRAAGQ